MFGCNLEKNNSSDVLCSNHKSSKKCYKSRLCPHAPSKPEITNKIGGPTAVCLQGISYFLILR